MNLLSVSVRNILSYGLEKFVGLYLFIFIHPTLGCERINFQNNASKRQVEPCSKNRSSMHIKERRGENLEQKKQKKIETKTKRKHEKNRKRIEGKRNERKKKK